MKAILKVVLLTSVLFLTACATTSPKQVIVDRPTLVPPPDNLILNCLVEPPPNMTAFMAASERERVAILSTKFNTQTKNTLECNHRLSQLRAWVKQQQAIYSQPSTP
jgi:hypothetical protein